MLHMRRQSIVGVSLALLALAMGCRRSAPAGSGPPPNEQFLTVARLRADLADSAGVIVLGNGILHSLDTLASFPQDEVVRVVWGTVADCRDGGSRPCPAVVISRCGYPSPFRDEVRSRRCPWGPPKHS